ncbi:RNA polymerase sigma factor SigW [Bacillaceae bacterium SIJ1]|uniref:RNA polymerase sigma factor SigW n=1 Tax=Litoribacterium kuwaitense TaxID=1398745 RepID=UPI0013EABBD9|nr:RNA polymerase sigma factor SigW [Litoribacterium kuwaitense]NGP46888.1 RNA polymerase sigma factor SigW [Litoribacterium kuwaitense]
MEPIVKERIQQVKKGDQNAYGDIVEIYKNKVYHICYRMLGNAHEAEDMAQEAFLRAYMNIHSYDPTKKFSTWLYRIATNVSIDRIRKRKPDYSLDATVPGTEGMDMYAQLAASDKLPEEEVESLELQRWIQEEMMSLPPKYRSAVVLKYIEELSLKEISDILDMPVNTVKTRIHRGREALRKRLGRT